MHVSYCYLIIFVMQVTIVSRHEYDDPMLPRLIHDVDTFFKTFSLVFPENFFPFLRFLPGSKVCVLYFQTQYFSKRNIFSDIFYKPFIQLL